MIDNRSVQALCQRHEFVVRQVVPLVPERQLIPRVGILKSSWAGALGVHESERSFLGRWTPKGSADAYVRTALRVVENVQILVAQHARDSLNGGPDYFGEEHLLAKCRSFLVARGWTQPDAATLAASLRRKVVASPAPADAPARLRTGGGFVCCLYGGGSEYVCVGGRVLP